MHKKINEDLERLIKSPISTLIKNLTKTQKILSSCYKNTIKNGVNSENEQILYDNFYILDSKIKMCLQNSKKDVLNVNKDFLPHLGNMIFLNCNGIELPKTQEVCQLINKVSQNIYITNCEFENIRWAFEYILIIKFVQNYNQKLVNNVNLMDLITLLTKSDLICISEIIQNCSQIEKLYASELSGFYSKLDDLTSSICRNKTSRLAKKLQIHELELASKFTSDANSAFENHSPEHKTHIGYYVEQHYKKYYKKTTPTNYISIIVGCSTAILLAIITFFKAYWLFILLILPIYEIVKCFVDLFISRKNEATYMPRLDFKKILSEMPKTAVVISTVITNADDTLDLTNKLKKLYFSNSGENLYFCILCDFKAAKTPNTPNDKILIRNITKVINSLNTELCNKFTCIIRKRTYSKVQNEYVGYERKRGAIEQFVQLVKGKKIDGATILGDQNLLANTQYLLALDYDTKPLLDTINQLVSIALHPLNKPVISNHRIIYGYGILAPRVSTRLKNSIKSPFSRLFGGIGSSCAYDFLCSNLYQDCFSEGIFSGKGLIHVEAFYTLCCNFFPENQVLSHDILEGNLMRTAFVGDVEFSDNFPTTTMSYFKRLHRWVRGDIQNLHYSCNNIPYKDKTVITTFSLINRYKIIDNIRRAITPFISYMLLFVCFFVDKSSGSLFLTVSLFSVITPYLLGIISSIYTNGYFSISKKYYSNAITQTKSLLAQGFYSLMLLPQLAIVSIDATLKSLWRKFISHKKLLEWTTSTQTDSKIYTKFRQISYYSLSEILNILLVFSPHMGVRLLGLVLSFMPLMIFMSDKSYKKYKPVIPTEKTASLTTDLSAMWQFYEKYCTKSEHFLPPDNVQFAPIERICHRTSPTNIGMMMMSILVARDFNLIDTEMLVEKINNTLSSVEKLQKYHGNLYNWYETETLEISHNPFVSSVDSGNFACCLVALKEGLSEFQMENAKILDLYNRITALVLATDLSIFYNKNKNLFSIGIDPKNEKLSENHYDLLMSESRMLSYFAIAMRLVPKKHWRMLGRTMKRSGNYSGSVAFSGTMFEFFMPELLLKSEYGSLAYESLRFCIHCQKVRGALNGVPFGISESAYYAFDNQLNYQYKAHGVQNVGLKRGLDKELVVSPYSTYLAMQMDFNAGYANLKLLKKCGTMGNFGHYEAIDFTTNRTTGSIIKSYMAHHVGMSIVSISNILMDGIMQKRFNNDNFMHSADELLEEKIISGSVIFSDFYTKNAKKDDSSKPINCEYFEKFYTAQPNVKLLSNGEYTCVVSDLGATVSRFHNSDVFLKTVDLLRRPEGCYFAVSLDNEATSFTYLPDYSDKIEKNVEFSENMVSFFVNKDQISLGMKISLHSFLPCEFRTFAIKNTSTKSQKANLLCYLEPILMNFKDYEAHPAFMKLFLKIYYDINNKAIVVSRKDRHSSDLQYCAIGFVENVNFICNFSRDSVLDSHGIQKLFINATKIQENFSHIPEPCIFMNAQIELGAKEQVEKNLFICMATSKEDLYRNIAIIRQAKSLLPPASPLLPNSIEEHIATSILPQILFKTRDGIENDTAFAQNMLPISDLWKISISGDLPIVIVEAFSNRDEERLVAYIKCHNALKLTGIIYDLVFIFTEKTDCESQFYSEIKKLIRKNSHQDCINTAGGIHLVNLFNLSSEMKTLLLAAAVHVAGKTLMKIGIPATVFTPIDILPISHAENAENSYFVNEKFIVNSKKSNLPWCHILANPVFGTLLSDKSLGFTYAINSRENKLTPWFNDVKSDNNGEMLLLKIDNVFYNLLMGSQATFTAESAIYIGETSQFSSKVTVSVSQTGFCKKISVEILPKISDVTYQIALYTEPVLGYSREHSKMLKTEIFSDCLVISNPNNTEIPGFMSLSSSEKFTSTTNREAFLSGKFNDTSMIPTHNPTAAIIVNKFSKFMQEISINFYISFGKNKDSTVKMPDLFQDYSSNLTNSITIKTPNQNLNDIFNTWIFNQSLVGRIYARTGFYQNSGAWGFRDQLQDSCAVVLKAPNITKQRICGACTAQFYDGDVLHWWHKLPKKIMRGVRTNYSDDLLWLPYTVCEYIEKTGDISIMDIKICYCDGELLNIDEQEKYQTVKISDKKESVYMHCKRAISYASQKLGCHGLPLIGCGDWNDGFNGVGTDGRGESVWLAQFFVIVLRKFAAISEIHNDSEYSKKIQSLADGFVQSVEETCWDGEWYLRAFFDDGTPIGSHKNNVCQIDSLSQSFSVLSNLPNKDRSNEAIERAFHRLVDRKNGIVKLFTPPFNQKYPEVGYVASYPEGIRENGGQYTHGAIWLAIALLEAGKNELGYEVINLLNPAEKYQNDTISATYKTEPYYITADIYTNPQCYGRGGWSIYTGAAGWYYRAIFEWLLGIKINKTITINPKIPALWNGFNVSLNYQNTDIEIEVTTSNDTNEVRIFDNNVQVSEIVLDGNCHIVSVIIPAFSE